MRIATTSRAEVRRHYPQSFHHGFWHAHNVLFLDFGGEEGRCMGDHIIIIYLFTYLYFCALHILFHNKIRIFRNWLLFLYYKHQGPLWLDYWAITHNGKKAGHDPHRVHHSILSHCLPVWFVSYCREYTWVFPGAGCILLHHAYSLAFLP